MVDAETVRAEMAEARTGLATQLESFTHNSTEFLRREQDLLLHGRGLPRPATRIAGRPVVVVVRGHDFAAELDAIRPYLREQDPVLIGVDRGADALAEAGFRADIVVIDGGEDETERPAAKVLRAARDVVVRVDRGGDRSAATALERLGVRPLRVETAATPGGRRPDPGRRRRRLGHRGGGHARHPRRVPRPPALRPGQHLPDPAQGRPARWWTPAPCPGSTPAGSARATSTS